jgi:HlyD family secretion protein
VFARGAIAEADRDRSEQNKLDIHSNLLDARQERTENDITITQLNQKIDNLRLQARQESEQMQNKVREAFDKLAAAIDIWEDKFLLQAPIDGVVSSPKYFSETQFVREGETVMTIIPQDPGEIIGKIRLPLEGSGMVKVSQTVNIQFADYPYLQFGMVKGEVSSISQVPEDDVYVLDVELPDGLKTYYGYDITFKQEMTGRAEIITDKRVLIERIFDPLRSVLTEQRETRQVVDELEPSE